MERPPGWATAQTLLLVAPLLTGCVAPPPPYLTGPALTSPPRYVAMPNTGNEIRAATATPVAAPASPSAGAFLADRFAQREGLSSAEIASAQAPRVRERGTDACRQDWRACADNDDVAKTYRKTLDARAACAYAAKNAAKYNSASLPWGSFQRNATGEEAPKTGILTLGEPNARFSNIYGTMVRTLVVCTYDFNKEEVLSIGGQEL